MTNLVEENYEWFVKNRDGLYDKYGHAYIAIKDKKVIGVYNDFVEGVHKTQETEQLGTFIVQECCTKEYELEHMPIVSSMFSI